MSATAILPLTLDERTARLREKKIAHTLEKTRQVGFMDGDDYGSVPLPEGFAFTPISNHPSGGFCGVDGWSRNFEKVMAEHPVYVDPLEILAGRWRMMLLGRAGMSVSALHPHEDRRKRMARLGSYPAIGADSHFAGDFRIGLTLGWGGLLEKVRHFRDRHGEEKRAFYNAEERVILAAQHWITRHILRIEELLFIEERPELRETLSEMLAANRAIRNQAPRTFLEAAQWLAHFASISRIYNRDGAGCALDQLLMPYYERDCAAGRLDRDKTCFIISNLLLVDTHYYQISGPDAEGRDQTNELSWLILEAAHRINISNNLTVRLHDQIDPAFFRRAVDLLFEHKNGWPRFCCHQGMMTYAKNAGVTQENALGRIAVGCNWAAVPGLEYPINDCNKINVARLFDLAFQKMMDHATETPPSTARLMTILEELLREAMQIMAEGVELHMKVAHDYQPELMLNLLMEGPLEEGLNINQCARLRTVGVDGVGIGTIADSFSALEQRIEDEGRVTWQEAATVLRENYVGVQGERIRQMFKRSDRYCQGASRGDRWAVALNALWVKVVREQTVSGGVQLVPGWFSWSLDITFGREVGATADGRFSGDPITHGANPNPGFRADGAVTAQATGIASVQCGYGNSSPLQLEFDPKLSGEEGGVERVMTLLKTHAKMGGTLININVLDAAKLRAAHANPLLYPDLVVRVTGFTAYFATLSPEFRELVVKRFIEGI